MKHLLTILLLASGGCAQMGTRQLDTNTTTRYEITPEGKTNAITTEVRETTTRSSGRAIFAASSTFEGLDASQDGESQGLKVDKSSQKSDADKMFDMIRALAPMAAAMGGIPIPQQQQAPTPVPAIQLQPAPAGMKWELVPDVNAQSLRAAP